MVKKKSEKRRERIWENKKEIRFKICIFLILLSLKRKPCFFQKKQKNQMDTNLPPSQRLDPYAYGISSGHSDLYSFFLGPPPRPGKDSAYAKKPVSKWNMPEAYIGESEFLRDTVEDWNFTANQTWYTQIVLPWYRTDQIHVYWEQWENNPSFMEHTPHQAASHIVSQMHNIRHATLVRRGIGAEFEHDFVKEAKGRTRFIASLAQIARSFQETANVEVIRALLGCHRSTQVFVRKFQVIKDGELDQYLDRKAARFMISQKETFGLEKLNVQIEQEQQKFKASPDNVWILSREVLDYCEVTDPNRTLYYLGGQEAVDRVNGRPLGNGTAAGGTMGNVRSLTPDAMIGKTAGVPVYLATSFAVDNLGELELLSRKVEVGVFNTMIDRARNHNDYKTESRNIQVYDEEIDDWAEITIQDAIDYCIVWAKDGYVDNPFTNSRRFGAGAGLDDNDFLRIRKPTATVMGASTIDPNTISDDVRYVGDLDPTSHFKLPDVLAAGQTVYNAIKKTNQGGLDAIEKKWGSTNVTTEAGLAALDTTTGVGPNSVEQLASSIENLLGKENVFFKGHSSVTNPGPQNKEPVWELFSGKYGTKKTQGTKVANIESSVSGSSAEEFHTKFLTNTLGSVVPSSHKESLNTIVGKKDQTWQTRAQQIESLILQCLKDDPSSVPSLPTEDRVKGWMSSRKETYETKLNERLASTPSLSSASGGSSSESEIKYFPLGTPLPQGYEYLNETEAERARRGTRGAFPSSLSEFTSLRHLFVSADQSTLAMGGRRGFAEIGAQQGEKRTAGRGDGANAQTESGKLRLSSRFATLDEHIKNIAGSSAPLIIKWLSVFYLGSEFTRARLTQFASHDIYIPAGFLLIRHQATYKTRYGIKCATGGKSGYTFMGHSDMQIAHEVTRKVGVMHYTVYFAPVVTNPKNVYVVEDIFCEKYLGGMGTKFWSRNDYLARGENQNRRKSASIVCTMLPPSYKKMSDKKLDIRGKYYTEMSMNLVDPTRQSEMCYPGAARTAMYMNWWDPVRGTKAVDKYARSRTIDMNFICWQGVQWHFNTASMTYGDITIEQGHFGPNVYPGCGRVRNGESKYLERASYLSTGGGNSMRL